MSSLKQLSANQLNKMLNETRAELERRENILKARNDIQAVLQKYNLTIHDLELVTSSRKPANKKAATKTSVEKKASAKKQGTKKRAGNAVPKKDQRSTVSAKYHDAATGDKWSGRGRAPAWVTNLCTAENIAIEQFKADPRFRV